MNDHHRSDRGADQTSERILAGRIRQTLALAPEEPAIVFDGRTLPWAYYLAAVETLDEVLTEFPHIRRVGIVLRNRPGSMAAVVATLAAERELLTLSPHLGDVGLAQDVLDLRPDLIIADAEDWARPALQDAAERIRAFVLLGGDALARPALAWTPEPTGQPDEGVAILMMTSGTTGRPKRVELSYDQMMSSFNAAGIPVDPVHDPRLRSGTVILWASLAHISGLYFAISHVLEGRSVALLEKFDVYSWAHLVTEHRPGYVRLAPTALRMVLNANLPAEVFESIRAVGSGTAPLPPDLAEEFEDRYGVPVLGTYGATEFAGAIAGWSLRDKTEWGLRKRGSVGRPFHGIELRIVNPETGELLGAGEPGLLEARGHQLPVDAANWLRTTDLASIDEDGFLYIHGRVDDAINRGGFKIPPSVIEEALSAHPDVEEAIAVGRPDERLGEVPVAAVTTTGAATEEDLMDFLSERLTRYQRPVALKIVEDLPRTPSMKVSRPLVLERFFSETGTAAV